MITRARIKELFDRYERPLSAGALVVGFIIDSLTLRSVALLAENLILIGYLVVAGAMIVVINTRERSILKHPWLAWLSPVAPLAMQVVFGALFSAFVVFYSRSASISASWPFMLFLAGMLVGNELFRPYYERLTFHVSVFFLALLSYSIFAVPVVLDSIGTWQFMLSVLVALAVTIGFIELLRSVARERVERASKSLLVTLALLVITIIELYALNIIPPVPLALNDSAVAHSVVRSGDAYQLSIEPRRIIDRIKLRETYHLVSGEPIYVWTSVVAPIDLNIPIVHEWQKNVGGEWTTMTRVTYPIQGGTDIGYRGYSLKQVVDPGEWRVSVETQRGQVIGRVRFDVVPAAGLVETELVER